MVLCHKGELSLIFQQKSQTGGGSMNTQQQSPLHYLSTFAESSRFHGGRRGLAWHLLPALPEVFLPRALADISARIFVPFGLKFLVFFFSLMSSENQTLPHLLAATLASPTCWCGMVGCRLTAASL